MKEMMQPLKATSLKEVFITRFEDLILTGRLAMGQKLPPERELALQLGVSRPVVHEGLLDLAVKGLVTMKPRLGTIVNDYRREGSLAILESLIRFTKGDLSPDLLKSLLDIRALVEIETSRLAAMNRTDEQMEAFRDLLSREKAIGHSDINEITQLDFAFHHLIALASGNIVYPLLLNSFKPVYTAMTSIFFSDPDIIPVTISFHERLERAIDKGKAKDAVAIMTEVLAHGEDHLISMIRAQRGGRP
ncbi:FadR family transcriptional regulator [bacterium]|nr:FadR family transcriptional regulator [bacterium]